MPSSLPPSPLSVTMAALVWEQLSCPFYALVTEGQALAEQRRDWNQVPLGFQSPPIAHSLSLNRHCPGLPTWGASQ